MLLLDVLLLVTGDRVSLPILGIDNENSAQKPCTESSNSLETSSDPESLLAKVESETQYTKAVAMKRLLRLKSAPKPLHPAVWWCAAGAKVLRTSKGIAPSS